MRSYCLSPRCRIGGLQSRTAASHSRISLVSLSPSVLIREMAHKGKEKAPNAPSKNFVTKEELCELLDDKITSAISEAIKPLLTAAKEPAASPASGSKEGPQHPGELLEVVIAAESYLLIKYY